MQIDLTEATRIGQNILALEAEGKLVLVIDPKVDLGPSSSGKMTGVANTGGFTFMPFGLKGNIYIGKK